MHPKKKRPQLERRRRLAETNKLPITASSALPVFRLLEINFAGGYSGRIIPRGLSVPTRIRFYEKFLFRLRVPSREHLFATFSPIHAPKRILLVIGRKDYLFPSNISFEKLVRSIEDSAWKDCDCAVFLWFAQLPFVESIPEDKWIKGMWRMYFV